MTLPPIASQEEANFVTTMAEFLLEQQQEDILLVDTLQLAGCSKEEMAACFEPRRVN